MIYDSLCSEMRGITVSESHTLVAKSEVVSEARTADVKRELVTLTLPAIAGQAIDPLTQLMETAYIGRLGRFDFYSNHAIDLFINNL